MRIEGLEKLTQLRMLYLQQNQIKKIENLCHLEKLMALNLSNNRITVIENLKGLDQLKNLDLSTNAIEKLADCVELKELPALESLDLKNNHIDEADKVLPFFVEHTRDIRAFHLKGNPCHRKINNYRKETTRALLSLTYLDDRPISNDERALADAFNRGGKEEEVRVRDEINNQKKNEVRNRLAYGKKAEEEGKKYRKELFKRMLEETRGKKDKEIKDLEEAKAQLEEMDEDDERKKNVLKKVGFLEDDLEKEYHKSLIEKGEEIPKHPVAEID